MSSCFLPGRSRTNQDDRYAPGPISSTDDGALIAGRAIGGKDSRTVSGVVVFGIHLAQRRARPVIRPVVSPRRSQPVKAPEQRDPARRSFDPLWPSVAERCLLAAWGAARIGGHRLATTTPPQPTTRYPTPGSACHEPAIAGSSTGVEQQQTQSWCGDCQACVDDGEDGVE